MKRLFLTLGLLFTINHFFAQSLNIVKNNVPNACIIVAPTATVQIKNAAKVLQDYLQQSTGALLPITTLPQKNTAIYVGKNQFLKKYKIDISKLDEDGFVLQGVDTKSYIIIGGSDWGTEYGVYEFLERYVGVYWLMPTEVGTEIPKHDNLLVPKTKIQQNPEYLSRQLSPIDINAKYPLGIWARFSRVRGRISFHHNLLNLFPPHQYAKTHPEFYPTINGEKHVPATDSDISWQANFSATGIADSAAEQIIKYFKNNPEVSSYSLGMNDSKNFDETAASAIRRTGRKNFLGDIDVSDDYYLWVNEVVDKVLQVFPNKKFGLLAYNNVTEPPVKTSLHYNVIPFITFERMRWADPALEKVGKEITERWAKQTKEIGWYDYVYGGFYLVPRVWFHTMQKYLLWGSNHQVKYYYAELYPNWGEGPKAWVLTKLLWNPNENVDSLLNVWYRNAAGKIASPYLKKFYSIWEKFWTMDIYKNSKWNTNSGQILPISNIRYLNDVPISYIDSSDFLIKKADTLADNPKRKELVGKLNEMWSFYKSCMITYSTKYSNREKEVENRLNIIDILKNEPLFKNTIDQVISHERNIVNRNWGNVR